ncbi:MAG: glycosyltransferase family 39 protein, partial [Terriglobales bacterium]
MPTPSAIEPARTVEGAREPGMVTSRIIPLVLVLLYLAQCAWFIRTQSFTIDEPLNIVAGLAHWHGNPSVADDNPPAARLLCSVLLLGSRSGRIIAADPDFDPGFGLDPYDVAWRTRSMNVLLGIALGIALWCAAKRLFSLGAANFALALYAFSPPVIAHFSIVGTDGIAALMIFVTAVQVARFRRDPSWRNALLAGAALGGLLLAKLYTLPIFALALLLMLLPSPLSRRLRKWRWSQT